uniref:putative cysteine-rich receptor-like protein kinase 35 n=1 Tax=Fragaria vesca subsp. vesca TaxID=101020 RepID=UPI0005CA5A0F|nr:PREDICTED: putative cysteine-rich receptor-like protein kinase 35 [Fragaria vesca subsp. vesca]
MIKVRPNFYAVHYTGAAFTWRNSIKMISLNTSIDLDRILLTAPPGQEMAIIYASGEAQVNSIKESSNNSAPLQYNMESDKESAYLTLLVKISGYATNSDTIQLQVQCDGDVQWSSGGFITLSLVIKMLDQLGCYTDGELYDVCNNISIVRAAATCNFSDKNKLGQGGFGPVYKGKFVTGQEIAVKRLSKRSAQGISEFKNKLIIIYGLQHTNLVQLFGFCLHGEERMLIYEFNWIPSSQQLDWDSRFRIIEGIAQGLLYLHKYSRTRIIHRDLKASNVLLDERMNPKISDFGMARIFANDEEEANTMKIVRTRGYMSPEYVMVGNFSTKSDVYSFGVLMLEILSGRKNNSFYNDDRFINLVGYAWALWREGAGLGLMDPTIGDSCDKDQMLRCIHVGLLCVEEQQLIDRRC